nr:hypothetical protein [Methanosarcina horonobensis]
MQKITPVIMLIVNTKDIRDCKDIVPETPAITYPDNVESMNFDSKYAGIIAPSMYEQYIIGIPVFNTTFSFSYRPGDMKQYPSYTVYGNTANITRYPVIKNLDVIDSKGVTVSVCIGVMLRINLII